MKRKENKMSYTEETIRARCEELAKQYWDMDFDLGIIITDELPEVTFSTFDYYEIDNKKVPVSITFSNKLFQRQPEEIIEAVFKYGLANWANTVRGIPNRNNDIEFLIELARVGGYIDGRIMKYGDTIHTVLCKCCDQVVAFFFSAKEAREHAKALGKDFKYGYAKKLVKENEDGKVIQMDFKKEEIAIEYRSYEIDFISSLDFPMISEKKGQGDKIKKMATYLNYFYEQTKADLAGYFTLEEAILLVFMRNMARINLETAENIKPLLLTVISKYHMVEDFEEEYGVDFEEFFQKVENLSEFECFTVCRMIFEFRQIDRNDVDSFLYLHELFGIELEEE